MARITIEDCLKQENDRFAIVHMAAQRTRQLMKGAHMVIITDDAKFTVSSLREIAAGKIDFQKVKPRPLESEVQVTAEPKAAPEAKGGPEIETASEDKESGPVLAAHDSIPTGQADEKAEEAPAEAEDAPDAQETADAEQQEPAAEQTEEPKAEDQAEQLDAAEAPGDEPEAASEEVVEESSESSPDTDKE